MGGGVPGWFSDYLYLLALTLPDTLFVASPIRIQTYYARSPTRPPCPSLSARLALVSSPLPLFVSLRLRLLQSTSSPSHFSPVLFLLTFQSQGHPGSQQQIWIQKVLFHGSPDSMTASPTLLPANCTSRTGKATWQLIRGPLSGRGFLKRQVSSFTLPGQVALDSFCLSPSRAYLLRSMVTSLALPLEVIFVVTLTWESYPRTCSIGEGQKSLHHVPSHTRFHMCLFSVWDGWSQIPSIKR